MSSDQFVIRFIKEIIVERQLEFNEISNISPMHESLVKSFESNGWSGTADDKHPRRFQMFNPDGEFVVAVKGISATRHPGVTARICRMKEHTKKMLNLAGVPNPTGAEFQLSEQNIAAEYFGQMPKPVVVKPTNSASSHGVSIDVATLEEFESAWDKATEESNERTRILVEEQVQGLEIRAYVVGDKLVAAAVRLPPFVVGDGESTVSELIATEQEKRRRNRKLRTKFETDWDFVHKDGMNENSVPNEGQVVLLHPFKTTSNGALFYDVTETINQGIVDLAVAAKSAIPNLEIAGIDILSQDIDSPQTAVILEVNTTPAPDVHRYPAYGKERPIHQYIADYYHAEYQSLKFELFRNDSMSSEANL